MADVAALPGAIAKPPDDAAASRTAAVISVAVQNRFGTTSVTVRMVPSAWRTTICTLSRVTWVTGLIASSGPPHRTSAVTPPASVVHSLLVRGAAENWSAGCVSSRM